jgi:maltooligosyltrehalose trehalohydrolase
MGEEWGATTPFAFFTSFDEGDLAEAIREGRRAEFAGHGWDDVEVPDPQDPATRDVSVLQWDEVADGDHRRLREWYAALIQLRHSTFGVDETRFANVSTTFDEAARWFVMRHRDLVVAANLGDESASVPVPDGSVPTLQWRADDGTGGGGIRTSGEGDHTLTLAPTECVVLTVS